MVGALGAAQAGVLRVGECPDEGGSQRGCSTVREGPVRRRDTRLLEWAGVLPSAKSAAPTDPRRVSPTGLAAPHLEGGRYAH